MTDVRKEYDDRLIERNINNINHNLTTTYSYYEYDNKLNRLPSNEVDYNNVKTIHTYNEDGIRILKTTLHNETKYYVSGRKVLRSRYYNDHEDEYIIDYHYDESGTLVGLHYDGKEYFYKKDILGIINGIIDEEGTPYVYYKYTAYGIPTSSINTNLSQNKQLIANILLNHNIYIYKDYIYDNETSLYYLNSRYYDPYIGRFISIDAIEYLDFEIVNGLNLYAYCGNNPVMHCDPEGKFWDTFFDILFICWDVYNLCTNEGWKDWKNWVALGADIIFACVPFIVGGESNVVKIADVTDDIIDAKKITVIGETMDRLEDTAVVFDCLDNLYGGFKYYDKLSDLGKGGKVLAELGGKASNVAWLYGKLKSGYKIIDIGVDIGRISRSSSYIVERLFILLWKSRNIWKGIYHFF